MPSPRIAIQGEFGSFSHEAAIAVAPQATIAPCALSHEVFARVVAGEVDAAVIPIENSLAGSVVEHYDLLFSEPVCIVEESLLRIRHMLIAPPGLEVDGVRRVYSHPVALAQCRRFFETHPRVEAVPFYDTAGSVKHLVEHPEPGTAAIASREAARVYRARLLLSGIEDNQENYTRFFRVERASEGAAVGSQDAASASAGKVSIAFVVENRPGTLVAALEVFAGLGTNLTRLESRPIPGKPWEYVFYADCELPQGRAPDGALDLLKRHCSVVKELGRYAPAALTARPSLEP